MLYIALSRSNQLRVLSIASRTADEVCLMLLSLNEPGMNLRWYEASDQDDIRSSPNDS
jgi:hypothetical protein